MYVCGVYMVCMWCACGVYTIGCIYMYTCTQYIVFYRRGRDIVLICTYMYLYYLTYLPTFTKESITKIMNIPKNEYNTTSSVTLFVFSSF